MRLSFRNTLSSVLFSAVLSIASLFIATAISAQEGFSGPKIASAKRGLGSLPSEAGQFWMVYDITPYTKLYPALPSPEQAIVNWILYDTGEAFWHKTPFGVFSADSEQLYVYHNEKVQQYVSNILDRFMNSERKNNLFQVQIILLDSPDWRSKAAPLIHPYPVNKKEISGWVIGKTEIQSFLQTLTKRPDYLELNASRNVVPNTETFGWVLPAPTRDYIRDIQIAPSAPQGYVTDSHSIDEGYRIEITPLVSTNGEQVEILLTCHSTAVEKMLDVSLKIPTANAPRQQLTAEVPQIARAEISDKISFPIDQVFLLDLGMIPIVEEAAKEKPSGLARIVTPKSIFRNVLVLIQKSELAVLPKPEPTQTGEPTPETLPTGS